MDVQLQQLGYEIGLGDKINFGFGYVELINKMAK
jgi:CRISPR/Cas system endoribonuclease Cas6 (RAMP superfamily)